MRYFKKIEGGRVYLSPMNMDDLPIYTKWVNDPEVSANLDIYTQVLSSEAEREALVELARIGQQYAIVLKDGDELIGGIDLTEINHLHRTASVGLFIGEARHRGRGYGSEAMRLILRYAFDYLNLHNITLRVHSDNQQAIAAYKKVGFKEIGRRREALYKAGRFIDTIAMDILRGELRD